MQTTGYQPRATKNACKSREPGRSPTEKAYRVGRAHPAKSDRLALAALLAFVLACCLLAVVPGWAVA
jgi:hypothetical protein